MVTSSGVIQYYEGSPNKVQRYRSYFFTITNTFKIW